MTPNRQNDVESEQRVSQNCEQQIQTSKVNEIEQIVIGIKNGIVAK